MNRDDHRQTLPVVYDNASPQRGVGDDVSRRDFVRVLSSAMAAVGAAGCDLTANEEIVPYVHRPPEVVPGVPRYYATSTERSGYGMGLLAETHTGRPTKLEGHPTHPASLGATFATEQAEILGLYDPDRPRTTRFQNQFKPFSALSRELCTNESPLVPAQGRGLHLLLEPTTSPLVASLLERVVQRFPETQVHFDPSQAPTTRLLGSQQAFGAAYEQHVDLTQARIIVDLSSDFLSDMPMSARFARDFASGRDMRTPNDEMNRLYSVETRMSITGAAADHRLATLPSRVPTLTFALFHRVTRRLGGAPTTLLEASRRHFDALSEHERIFVGAMADDLMMNRTRCAIFVGERQPPEVHVVAHALSEALGNRDSVVTFTPSTLLGAEEPSRYSHERLENALFAGDVHSLFILGGNPAYSAPGDARLVTALGRARRCVYLGDYENETARSSTWFVPRAHFLESWGDARASDGTVSFRQPTIAPLFGGRSQEELLALLAREPSFVANGSRQHRGNGRGGPTMPQGREVLRDFWMRRLSDEKQFEQALGHGLLSNSAHARERPSLVWSAVERALASTSEAGPPSIRKASPDDSNSPTVEVEFVPDPRLGDGRRANNAWLQETPEPISKLVWDNAALIHPETAREHGLDKGDVIELQHAGISIEIAVLPSKGQAEGSLCLWLGYGRVGNERVASQVGVDVAPLRRKKQPWWTPARLKKTARNHQLVTTQSSFDMHDREIVLHATRKRFAAHPDMFREHAEEPPSLYRKREDSAPQWGMTIDLNRCTGCSACVTACVSENNIPMVGKEMVAMGREMQWLRIDTYRQTEESHPDVLSQPMLCQHCEKAPCEYVCPVNATVHSEDGLNEMVYNRCVGTRFCSNNCPYKVRRFNWFDFNENSEEPKPMAHNPDVTVRARGVMEKCTFCVQRIRRSQIDAKLERRTLKDGDVTTACAQVCPSQAITFGSLSDENSRVSQRVQSPRSYHCLGELGTRPRVTYLAKVSNPHQGLDREGKP